MKVYIVRADTCDYDMFDSVVIVAENEERALEIVKSGYLGGCYFNVSQGEMHVEEVDLSTECVILASFNTG